LVRRDRDPEAPLLAGVTYASGKENWLNRPLIGKVNIEDRQIRRTAHRHGLGRRRRDRRPKHERRKLKRGGCQDRDQRGNSTAKKGRTWRRKKKRSQERKTTGGDQKVSVAGASGPTTRGLKKRQTKARVRTSPQLKRRIDTVHRGVVGSEKMGPIADGVRARTSKGKEA